MCSKKPLLCEGRTLVPPHLGQNPTSLECIDWALVSSQGRRFSICSFNFRQELKPCSRAIMCRAWSRAGWDTSVEGSTAWHRGHGTLLVGRIDGCGLEFARSVLTEVYNGQQGTWERFWSHPTASWWASFPNGITHAKCLGAYSIESYTRASGPMDQIS